MFKALLKKQLLESIAFLSYGKDGKKRTLQKSAGFAVLLLFAFLSLGSIFYLFGQQLCAPFVVGLKTPWLYFAFMGAIATAFGVIGSIFMAKSTLYEAKDNDLLFSMPIPSWMVLFSRMVGLYIVALLFEALVMLPAILAYCIEIEFSFLVVASSLVALLIMPFGALAICCMLGWLLAIVAAKLPWKNLLTVILSIAFMVGYFIVCSKMNEYLALAIANGGKVAEVMKTWLFPFWKLGLACSGDWLAMGLYALLFLAAFALVYAVISVTYLRLATANKGSKKAKYKGKNYRQTPVVGTLLKKELQRFTKKPMIALNALLGAIFLLVLPFVALFFPDFRKMILEIEGTDELFAMILACVLCAIVGTNIVSGASISLEGDSLWILQSLPVSTGKILYAKALFQWLVTGIPATFCAIFLCILYQIGFWYALCAWLCVMAFVTLGAVLGLTLNLLMPNLHWKNELAAVKQSGAAMLSMLLGWVMLALLVGGYIWFGHAMFACGYMLVAIAFLSAVSGLLVWWIGKKGCKIFQRLS